MESRDDYSFSASTSRENRAASLDAVQAVEYALAAPAPGREAAWLDEVVRLTNDLLQLLDAHAESDDDPAGFLSRIAQDQPRLSGRVDRLRRERDDLRSNIASLNEQIGPGLDSVADVADIRDRLASITRRYRQHRARESDLIYEATSVDIGGPG